MNSSGDSLMLDSRLPRKDTTVSAGALMVIYRHSQALRIKSYCSLRFSKQTEILFVAGVVAYAEIS